MAISLTVGVFFAMDFYSFQNPFLKNEIPAIILHDSLNLKTESEISVHNKLDVDTEAISEIAMDPPKVDEKISTVPLVWSSETPHSVSQVLAYEKLFSLWDVDYILTEDGQACRHALKNGLRCLFKRGSLGSLRQLNRPAVLRLSDGEGQEFFGTLLWLTDEAAVLSLGTEEIEVALSELQTHWLGEFTILWRPPPDYEGKRIGYGKYPPSEWLAEQLAAVQHDAVKFVGGQEGSSEDWQRQVEIFQTTQGLKADGIIGPQTLIRLNTVNDHGVPLLIQTSGEDS